MLPRAPDGDPLLPWLAPQFGEGDGLLAREIAPGDGSLVREQLGDRPGVDDLPTVLPRSRADVDDVVGCSNGLLVVLDDQHRVAQVAQAQQRVEEASVVSLMEADGGLVEDVQHAHEPAADLARQPDALRFPTGQRGGRASQAEVVEPDVPEEPHAGVDLLDHPFGDDAVVVRTAPATPGPRRPPRWTWSRRRGWCARRP